MFILLLGYYLPNDDGEFYQFCYVTHKGEIRGASTPFQFRAASPVEELLTMEDEGNSDMLVVTTKAGLLEVGTNSDWVIDKFTLWTIFFVMNCGFKVVLKTNQSLLN